ncbi:ATP synthase subunit a [Fundidesulfovibrio magnetotacticus]|uniref:ATP synthase subunit a n=1 Tax=Fundidesulfovibrio magnetotacticus TaxID=2730080 RepID=A0A6V8LTB3_9BACT|nr:F0F1 ATP synthase subunit A [Fundidesulfovibrio magnetotacticus]GFK92877.1 ATP synthase subunit a [Fundidesulfovibrio magnetotacticus]
MAGGLDHPVLFLEMAAKGAGMHIPNEVLFSWLAIVVLLTLGLMTTSGLKMVPGGLQNFFEFVIGGLENFIVETMGEDGRKVTPILVAIFLYILTCNFMGLIPGFDSATNSVNHNAAMALFVFIYYNYWGIRNWGPGYIKHFMGPMPALAPMMIILEFMSHLARPLSLTLRLFGNIRGEELVLILLFMLAPIVSTFPLYFLFMLADFIQAFVFFMLTLVYLKGAFEHAH